MECASQAASVSVSGQATKEELHIDLLSYDVSRVVPVLAKRTTSAIRKGGKTANLTKSCF